MTRLIKSDFGGAGDGYTDDTDAVRRAINSIGPHQGGEIHFEAGRYRINNPITVYAPSAGPIYPTISGEGRGEGASSLYLMNPNAPALIAGGGVGLPQVRDMEVKNLQMLYAHPPAANMPMIVARGVKGLRVHNVRLRHYRILAKIGDNADGPGAGSCEDVRFFDVKGSAASESYTGDEPDAKSIFQVENVNGIWVESSNVDGVHSQHVFHFTCRGQVTVDTVRINNNVFKDNRTGIRAGDGTVSNLIASGNFFDKCQLAVVQLESEPDTALTRWRFADDNWYYSEQFLGIVAQRPGGRISGVSFGDGLIEKAPSKWWIAGNPGLRLSPQIEACIPNT